MKNREISPRCARPSFGRQLERSEKSGIVNESWLKIDGNQVEIWLDFRPGYPTFRAFVFFIQQKESQFLYGNCGAVVGESETF
jgi:hypothetical protein